MFEDDRPVDLPLPPLADGPEPGADGARLGPVSLAVDTLRRPSAAMARLTAHPDRRWLVPVLALVVVAVVTVVVEMPAARALQRQTIEAGFEQMPADPALGQSADDAVAMATSGVLGMATLVFGLVAATVGTVAGVLIVAAVLHLLGTVVGGQQTYSQVLAATSWARLPLVIGGLVWIAYVLAGNWDPSPAGLSGLVAPVATDVGGQRSYLEPLLARIELWNLWYLGLLVVAVRAVSRVSKRKAVAVVAVLVAVQVALGLVGIAAAREFAGFQG